MARYRPETGRRKIEKYKKGIYTALLNKGYVLSTKEAAKAVGFKKGHLSDRATPTMSTAALNELLKEEGIARVVLPPGSGIRRAGALKAGFRVLYTFPEFARIISFARIYTRKGDLWPEARLLLKIDKELQESKPIYIRSPNTSRAAKNLLKMNIVKKVKYLPADYIEVVPVDPAKFKAAVTALKKALDLQGMKYEKPAPPKEQPVFERDIEKFRIGRRKR